MERPKGKALYLSIHKQTRALSLGRQWGPNKTRKRRLEGDSHLLQKRTMGSPICALENIPSHKKCSKLLPQL